VSFENTRKPLKFDCIKEQRAKEKDKGQRIKDKG
jgi:hypothetical protein